MFSNIANFLFNIIFYLFSMLLILRFWIKAVHIPAHHPIVQNVLQFTNWFVQPISSITPRHSKIDWASGLGLYLCALIYCLLINLLFANLTFSLSLLSQLLLPALFIALKWILGLVSWVIIIMALISWIAPQSPAMGLLAYLCAPLLNPIRRLLPQMSGLDLSPLFAFIIIQVLQIILAQLSVGVLS